MLLNKFYSFYITIISKFFVSSCRDIMSLHESFCKRLTPFQLCTLHGRADNCYLFMSFPFMKEIRNAINQWFFRANKNHVHIFLQTKSMNRLEIIKL